ncbi:hypothetical protein Tco_0444688 [Tanacetum coccineum]
MSQAKEAQIKFYKTREDKELDKVIALENKVKVLYDIVYKTGQSVQTMNMLNRNCKTSFAKPEFLKKAQRANPHLYDIGCYNDNLALMLAPESDETIRLDKESRSKLSDLIRPFDYDQLNNLYDLFVPQQEKSPEQHYFPRTEYYYDDLMIDTWGVHDLDEVNLFACDYCGNYVETYEHLKKVAFKKLVTCPRVVEALQMHAITFETYLQQCKDVEIMIFLIFLSPDSTNNTQGQIKVLPPRTTEEILARERERKARTTLLMALPEDHLAKFHKMTDAKEMWDAIKSRFGGNDESKKMQKYILKQQFEGFSVSNSEGLHKGYDRFQSLLSQLEIHGAGVSTEDANQKFLRSLPSAWSQVSLIMRTKPGVDSLSFDDLYNNLRVFENDVKGSTASSSSTQNVAFVSENTSSTNDVSTAYGVSNPSGQNSQYEHASSYSLLANQSSCPQLDHEDLEQLDEFDLEEMDLKWQVAMISMRMKKFYKKTESVEPREFNIVRGEMLGTLEIRIGEYLVSMRTLKLWLRHIDEQRTQLSDASIEIKAYTQALKKVEAQLVAHQQGQLWYEEKIRFMKIDLDDKTDVLTYHKKLLAEAEKEKEDLKAKVEKWHNSSKNLSLLQNSQMSANDKFGLGYGDHRYDGILSYENEVLQSVFMNKESDLENQPLYNRFVTAEGMHATQTSESETQTSDFDTCESDCSVETHESLPEPAVNEPKVVNQPKVWSDAPIIEEYESDSEDEHVSLPTEKYKTPSFANQEVKTHRETVKNQFTYSKNPKVDNKGLGYGFTTKACFVCGSLSHLIRDYDFHEKRMAQQAELNNRMRKKSSQKEIRPIWNNVQRVNHKNQFVPTTVLTRTGKIPMSTARASGINNVTTVRHNFNSHAVLTNAAMKISTVKLFVNRVRPKTVFHKTHSPFIRPFNNTTVLRTKFSKQKVNTAEVNAVSAVGGKRETAVKLLAGCNWRPKRHYWHNISKYNGGSRPRDCATFKDPLGRLKPKQAWVPRRI